MRPALALSSLIVACSPSSATPPSPPRASAATQQAPSPSLPQQGRVEGAIGFRTYGVQHTDGVSGCWQLYRDATARLEAHDVAGARSLYEEAHRREPEAAQAWVGLGSCELADQHYPGAQALFEQALARDAHSVLAHVGLGSAEYLQARFADSARAYEAAISDDERNADAHWGAACAYEKLGDMSSARRHARRFLELAPDSALAGLARRMIVSP